MFPLSSHLHFFLSCQLFPEVTLLLTTSLLLIVCHQLNTDIKHLLVHILNFSTHISQPCRTNTLTNHCLSSPD